jgi:hypothetical protein
MLRINLGVSGSGKMGRVRDGLVYWENCTDFLLFIRSCDAVLLGLNFNGQFWTVTMYIATHVSTTATV